MKINEQLVKYEAVLILRKATGWEAETIANAVRNWLGIEISPNTVRNWIYYNKTPRLISPLIKSLFYKDAYELALRLKEENPSWGYYKIRGEIKRKLRIWIPLTTIYRWIAGKSHPNMVPLNIVPELGYVVGALLSDCTTKGEVILRVGDKDFAEEFAKALKEVAGKRYKVRIDESYFVVRLRGSALRYIVRSGLWKVIAYLYPREFLQGLFDGDGGVGVVARNNIFIVSISLTNSNREVLAFTKQLLEEKFGIRCTLRLHRRRGENVKILGIEYTLKRDCWELRIWRQEDVFKFYEQVGFRIKRKQRKIEDGVTIQRTYKTNRERVKAWLKKYVKKNGKWIPRPPPLFISLTLFSLVLLSSHYLLGLALTPSTPQFVLVHSPSLSLTHT